MIGIGEYPEHSLDDQLKGWMTHYHQVQTVIDVGIMTDAVRWVQDKVWVDRLETSIEAHTLATAQVRENCGDPGYVGAHRLALPGQAVDEAGAAGGRRTRRPRRPRPTRPQEVYDFADAVGYPLILKPRSGAGAQDTTRVDNRAELDAALGAFGGQGTTSIAVEEFVEGHEGFYDTLSINGDAALDFVCHYYPNVLDAMRSRWISPQFISTNRVDSVGEYQQLREMGHRVNEALGIGTSATHMEWFFGPKGLRFSEIGCRPPGRRRLGPLLRRATTSTSTGSGPTRSCTAASTPSRRDGSPAASSRCAPTATARSRGYSGVDEIAARYNEWVIDAHLPDPGTPTQARGGRLHGQRLRADAPSRTSTSLRGMLDEVGQHRPRVRPVMTSCDSRATCR